MYVLWIFNIFYAYKVLMQHSPINAKALAVYLIFKFNLVWCILFDILTLPYINTRNTISGTHKYMRHCTSF